MTTLELFTTECQQHTYIFMLVYYVDMEFRTIVPVLGGKVLKTSLKMFRNKLKS